MQLNNKPIRQSLALATATLLAGTSMPGYSADTGDWEIDSGILYYSEDGRVSAIEPVIQLRKYLGDEEAISARLVVDSLTGSSANGARATDSPQTFTSPSGKKTYTTNANETPLDPTFRDSRVALNTQWDKPLSQTLRGVFAFNGSVEHDYTSLGISSTMAKDFNQRNTTLTAGFALSHDSIKPLGGIPVGMSAAPTSTSVSKAEEGSKDTKIVSDLLLGLTQVVGRNTLMQLNYNYGRDTGYLSDPYKLVSVMRNDDPDTLANTPYLYEKRPDSKTRNALYWKLVHQFSEDVLHLSYRYYWDDWGLSAHTIDAKYRYEFAGRHYLMPHIRYSRQYQADFYHYQLSEGDIPSYASADYRLADMSTTTLGLKYGIQTQSGSEFSVRAEVMTQQSEGNAPFPDVDANIIQLNYSMTF